jgi:hypothetical protein
MRLTSYSWPECVYAHAHVHVHTHAHIPARTHTRTQQNAHARRHVVIMRARTKEQTGTMAHNAMQAHTCALMRIHARVLRRCSRGRRGLRFCVCVRFRRRATPLHYAADSGHTAVVAALLAHGADVNATTIEHHNGYRM